MKFAAAVIACGACEADSIKVQKNLPAFGTQEITGERLVATTGFSSVNERTKRTKMNVSIDNSKPQAEIITKDFM